MRIGLILSAFLFSSCSHYYYVANIRNVPLFTEKNEYRASGSLAMGDETRSIELQGAYSVSKNIAIMAAYMHAKGESGSDRDSGKGNYFEVATGYYKPFKRNYVFEVYGGLGFSSQRHEYWESEIDPGSWIITDHYAGNSRLSFFRLFLQPSIGIAGKNVEVALSGRFCNLSFTGIDDNIYNSPITDEFDIISGNSHWFFEPAITVRTGWENTKIQVQAGYSGILNSQLTFAEELHMSAGIYFKFKGKTGKAAN